MPPGVATASTQSQNTDPSVVTGARRDAEGGCRARTGGNTAITVNRFGDKTVFLSRNQCSHCLPLFARIRSRQILRLPFDLAFCWWLRYQSAVWLHPFVALSTLVVLVLRAPVFHVYCGGNAFFVDLDQSILVVDIVISSCTRLWSSYLCHHGQEAPRRR